MNEFQQTLFQNLNNLVLNNEAFFVTKTKNPYTGTSFWMFNYRLPTYTDFLQPSAMESRGVMFEMNNNEPVRLASFPMFKFFNLHENPLVMNLDLSKVARIETKHDGSLISTFQDGESGVFLKTKGSLTSEQAVAAYSWITNAKNQDLWAAVQQITFADYTVNMEWTSPLNRIVLAYQQETLFILNVRNNVTGAIYSSIEELQSVFPSINISVLQKYWVENTHVDNLEHFINNIETMQGIEGFIVKFHDGMWVKIKTQQYRDLHKLKDSILNNKALYACVVNEGVDELKSLFYDDEFSMKRIVVAENHVSKHFNHLVKVVEDFYENNKTLDRKSYAVKGQQDLEKHMFVLAMEKYIGRAVDYKTAMIKYYDLYPLPLTTVDESHT